MALGGAAWRNETRAWRRAMLKTPRPNTVYEGSMLRSAIKLMSATSTKTKANIVFHCTHSVQHTTLVINTNQTIVLTVNLA